MEKGSNDVIQHILNNFINEGHRKTVEEYIKIRERIDKVSYSSRRNDAQSLIALSKFLKNKPYAKATQEDMMDFEEYLQKEYQSTNNKIRNKGKGLGAGTIELYEIHIKRFYKYVSNKKEYMKGKRFQKNIIYPDSVAWISTSTGNHKKLPLDYILTDEDVYNILEACDNPRDQALIVSLYDGGLRISELTSLNVKSIAFDKLGAYFLLPKLERTEDKLKTGMRKIRLFLLPSSTQYLKTFLNSHPFKKYPNAPLFYSMSNKTFPVIKKKIYDNSISQEDFEKVRLTRPSIENHMKYLGEVTNLSVRLHPHFFRHCSCTKAAKAGFNEMELRIRYGWSPTSKMPSRYTHLASKDLDDKIKVITGFKEPEKPEDTILQPILCPNCDYENVPTNVVCGRCGMKLNISKEDLGIDATTTGIMTQEMLEDSKFREFYKESLLMTWDKYKELQNRKKEVK